MINIVRLNKRAEKDLRKVPKHVVKKLRRWVAEVIKYGLEEVRKVPGWHDEPLKGERAGQRSIRLSRAYRAFYRVLEESERAEVIVEYALVEEVNKHEY